MTEEARTLLWTTGVITAVAVAVLGGTVHEFFADSDATVPLGVADVEGAWIAEDSGDARLVVRADGSAELTREGRVDACGWGDSRAVRATWFFGDSDDPRMMHFKLWDPDTTEECFFDLTVADSGRQATLTGDDAFATYVRADTRGEFSG